MIIFTIVKAGSLTPSASPAATGYTLSDIYKRLTTNATSIAGDHSFSPGASPAGTLYTLTEIYGAIPTINPSKLLSDTIYLGITGSVADCASEGSQSCYAAGTYFAGTSKTPSNSATSQSAGYYPAFDLAAVDTDLTASKIMADVDIFGVSGTLLKNLYNGSATSGDYPRTLGGVDDYNNNGTMPSDSYTATWTTCNADNSYCATDNEINADKKDNSTNLVWSKWLGGGTSYTWFWANNCYEPGVAENPGACASNGDDACQCVKKTSSLVGCEALGAGWRLPYQKELMQAYINGSWGNLSLAGYYYWSATTRSYTTSYAWYTNLGTGGTSNYNKTNTLSVRCGR